MSKADLSANTRAVQSFRQAIEFCTLPHVPQTTRRILSTGAWRDRFEMGRRIQFNDLVEFVTQSSAKGGMGWTPDKVTALLRKSDDAEALKLWKKALREKTAQKIEDQDRANLRPAGPHIGRDVDNSESGINISGRPTGTSRAAALRRLRKDRPDIHKRVLAGELSPHAGMIEAGFRKRAERRKLTPYEQIARLISKCLPVLTPTERQALGAMLDEDGRRAA